MKLLVYLNLGNGIIIHEKFYCNSSIMITLNFITTNGENA